MAYAPESANSPKDQSLTKDCFAKRGVPKCAVDSSNALSSKRLKLDEALACNPEVEYDSEDEPDQGVQALSMAIDERLTALQLLLPQGPQMENDEILRVLVDYVKELESKIKTFHSSTDGWDNLEASINDSPLQRRGLCIVPLSTLANAL